MKIKMTVCVLALSAAANASADDWPYVEVGRRVRVEAPNYSKGAIKGKITEMFDAAILVRGLDGSEIRIPKQDIVLIEVSTNRKRHPLAGAVVGGALGLLGSFAVCKEFSCTTVDYLLAPTVYAFGGAAVGALIRTETWEHARVPPIPQRTPSVATPRGFQITLRF